MLLFHEICHSPKIYLLIEGLKLENGILKENSEYDQEIPQSQTADNPMAEVDSNESDDFAC